MAFLGAVAAGAAGDVSCGKEPSAVRVKGEIVGGAILGTSAADWAGWFSRR